MTIESDPVRLALDGKNAVAHVKRQLAEAINKHRADNKITQTKAAAIADTNQSRISEIYNYKLDGFRIDALIKIALMLGLRVTFDITDKAPTQ